MPATKTKLKKRSTRTSTRKGPKGSSAKKKGRDEKPKKAKKKKKPTFTAKTADKHTLYQHAVQSPEEDVRFLSRVYKRVRGRKPLHFP